MRGLFAFFFFSSFFIFAQDCMEDEGNLCVGACGGVGVCMGVWVRVSQCFFYDLALAQADAKHGDALHEANEIEHALNKMTSSTMAIAHLLYSIGISRGISPPL
jgi:hypothetical protein